MENEQVKKKNTSNGKKFNIKSYLRDFFVFVDKKLLKTTGILFVVAILLIAVSFKPIVTVAIAGECEGGCTDSVTLISNYWSNLKMLLLTICAGIAPYFYISILGFIGYLYQIVSSVANLVKDYGYAIGIGLGIVPLLLNMFSICLATALGIYICKHMTLSYRASSAKNMNMTQFRIKLYEVLRKEEKAKALTKVREDKIEKIESKKEKLKYIQILNTVIVLGAIQFISALIQEIIL